MTVCPSYIWMSTEELLRAFRLTVKVSRACATFSWPLPFCSLLAGLLSFCLAVSYFFSAYNTDQHKIWQTPAYVQHHKRPSELAWFRSTFTALLCLDVYSVSQYVQRWLRGAVMPNLFVSPSRQAETASLTGS